MIVKMLKPYTDETMAWSFEAGQLVGVGRDTAAQWVAEGIAEGISDDLPMSDTAPADIVAPQPSGDAPQPSGEGTKVQGAKKGTK